MRARESVCVQPREREGQRERQTDRQRHRDTHTNTHVRVTNTSRTYGAAYTWITA